MRRDPSWGSSCKDDDKYALWQHSHFGSCLSRRAQGLGFWSDKACLLEVGLGFRGSEVSLNPKTLNPQP